MRTLIFIIHLRWTVLPTKCILTHLFHSVSLLIIILILILQFLIVNWSHLLYCKSSLMKHIWLRLLFTVRLNIAPRTSVTLYYCHILKTNRLLRLRTRISNLWWPTLYLRSPLVLNRFDWNSIILLLFIVKLIYYWLLEVVLAQPKNFVIVLLMRTRFHIEVSLINGLYRPDVATLLIWDRHVRVKSRTPLLFVIVFWVHI